MARAAVFWTAALVAGMALPAAGDEAASGWVTHLQGREVGEEQVTTTESEAGRVLRSSGEARLIQQPFRYSQRLEVGPAGELRAYRLESESHTLTATVDEAGIRLVGTVVGRETEVALPAPHPVVCLDNLVFSHYDELGRRAVAAEGGFAFVALVPQALAAPVGRFEPGAEVRVRGPEQAERAARRGVVTIASTRVELVYDAETGVAYHVDVPAQGLTGSRRGWEVVAQAETPQGPPATAYREHEISFSSPYGTLPGTLTVPAAGDGPFPTALVLPGSGPQDRHTSIGPNRPLQDLARGLAARGVASLRFDKRAFLIRQALIAAQTREERQRILADAGESLDDEYVEDALAALAWLRQRDDVDAGRLVLVGHSLGGLAAPLVAAAEGGSVQGMVLMAAPGRRFDVLLEEQLAFQARVAGKDEAEAQAQAEQTVGALRRVLRGELPPTQRVLGASGAYWKDVCSRDLPGLLAESPLPVLLLQGAQDCQVAQADYQLLGDALDAREAPSAQRLFPRLNHLFMPVEGESTGAEYAKRGELDPQVPEAIATWIEALESR